MGIACRPEAITALQKLRLEHGLKNARNGPLQKSVADCGYPQRPRPNFARSFGYFDPSNRRRPIPAFFELCANALDLGFQVLFELLGALSVNASCRSPVHLPPSFLEKLRC